MQQIHFSHQVFRSKSRTSHQVFRSKSRTSPPVYVSSSESCRPHKYGTWKLESLEKAMAAVDTGTSVRKAAEMYGIPRFTLHDHVRERVLKTKPGPNPYLSEKELVNFLFRRSSLGYPHTRQQVLGLVQQILDSKGVDVRLTNGWWERFKKRHSDITLKTALALSYVHAMARDEENLHRYYDLLEQTLIQNGILDCPTQLFNCGETGVPLNPKPLKVVSSKDPSYISSSSKRQITVLACGSAAGYALPPYVIFTGKTLKQMLTIGEVPGTIYGLSDSGWMDMELFKE